VIDIAERPEVSYQRGQAGIFIARSGQCGAGEKGISHKSRVNARFRLASIFFTMAQLGAESLGYNQDSRPGMKIAGMKKNGHRV